MKDEEEAVEKPAPKKGGRKPAAGKTQKAPANQGLVE